MISKRGKKLLGTAKWCTLKALEKSSLTNRELEPHVLTMINGRRSRKEGRIIHETKPIHALAFILAFEELEREKQICIDRHGLPVCMTDNETVFKLAVKEGL
jgi:hypothetical protein